LPPKHHYNTTTVQSHSLTNKHSQSNHFALQKYHRQAARKLAFIESNDVKLAPPLPPKHHHIATTDDDDDDAKLQSPLYAMPAPPPTSIADNDSEHGVIVHNIGVKDDMTTHRDEMTGVCGACDELTGICAGACNDTTTTNGPFFDVCTNMYVPAADDAGKPNNTISKKDANISAAAGNTSVPDNDNAYAEIDDTLSTVDVTAAADDALAETMTNIIVSEPDARSDTAAAADNNAKSSFPASWGPVPMIQTRDYVKLPLAYGHGSSTLQKWIQSHLDADNDVDDGDGHGSAGVIAPVASTTTTSSTSPTASTTTTPASTTTIAATSNDVNDDDGHGPTLIAPTPALTATAATKTTSALASTKTAKTAKTAAATSAVPRLPAATSTNTKSLRSDKDSWRACSKEHA
jgi:hypothetical protein